MANTLIADRPMSGFPVSMGTGLSLETLFTPVQEVVDTERQFTKLEDPKTYSLYMINVATIARNLLSNFNFEELFKINRKDLIEAFYHELDFIKLHFLSQSLPLIYYYNTYDSVKKIYSNKDRLRVIKTDKQFKVHDMMELCMKALKERNDVMRVDSTLPPSKKDKVLVLTHIPYDLLSYRRFHSLDLLESNSGAIKSRKLWWTKYYPVPNEDMSFMPLMEYALSILGDGVMFKPSKLKERQALLNQFRMKGVHPLSTEMSMEFMGL